MTMWKVTAGRGNRHVQFFLERGVVAIGWHEMEDVTAVASREALLERHRRTYPDDSPRQAEVGAGQVWKFVNQIKLGDTVVTYDPQTRLYHLGIVQGAAVYRPAANADLPTQRAVEWRRNRSRDDLTDGTRNALGAITTLFRVNDAAAAELEGDATAPRAVETIGTAAARATAEAVPEIEIAAADPYEQMADQALERTKDRLLRLDWAQMQELVAALLRALGYRTLISPMGADRGKDIIASRDGFGFERPRIVVEVKHRKEAMGAPEIRSFLGGRHADDRGLYVSTGGFTRDAQYEAERASTVTHLMNLDGLARAVIDQYDLMDEAGRRLLPMTRLYWPD